MEANSCALCFNETEFWAVSSCEHRICLLCSARLRILCKQNECPQCRESQEEVVVTNDLQPYDSLRTLKTARSEHGFVFANESSHAVLLDILASKCPICKEPHQSMKFLQDHVRRAHDRHYCEICVKELKLFPFEHKVYTRQLLVEHRRDGDQDDKSHKGHPLCSFCDVRYLDKEKLFFHLKEKHFWCHFCEADGKQEYYASYPRLRMHYRKRHFLCEEGRCRCEKYTSVFRTSLDFQAHRAKVHIRGLSKAEVKQLRQVDVGFTYARETPAPHHLPSRGRVGNQASCHPRETEEIEKAKAKSLAEPACAVNTTSSREKKGRTHTGQKSPLHTGINGSEGSTATSSDPPPSSCQTARTVTASTTTAVKDGKEPPHEEKRPVQVNRKEPPHEEKRPVQVKPPPGLESVVTLEPLKQEEAWPMLESVPTKKGPSTGPPPGFRNIAPKPCHHSSSHPMHSPWCTVSQTLAATPKSVVPGKSAAISSSTHVGAVSNKTDVLTSLFASNSDVIQIAEGILGNNADKVSRFRSLSGSYQSGAISVDKYHAECQRLFGPKWKELGPRLATTIPDKGKQDRLLKKFGRSFVIEEPLPWNSGHSATAAAVKKYAMDDRKQAAWLYGGSRHNWSMLSEEEYPSLDSKVGIPTHSATPSWSCKVSVK